MKKSDVIKLAVALALFLGAGLWFFRGQSLGDDDIPDDPSSASFWMCKDCGHVQTLTDRQYDDQRQLTISQQLKDKGEGEGEEHMRMGRAATLMHVLICPKCGKVAAMAAVKCPKDGEFFIDRLDLRTPNSCPKCGWSRGRPQKSDSAEG